MSDENVKELVNKFVRSPEEYWIQAVQGHYLMRVAWVTLVTEILGYKKTYEIHTKVWKDFLFDDSERLLKELKIEEMDTRAAAQVLALQGSIYYRMEAIVDEFTPNRTVVRIVKCPIFELGKKQGWLKKMQKCESCVWWWEWIAQKIHPKMKFTNLTSLARGDSACKKLLEIKE